MRIYVGNLSFQTTEDGLRSLFGEYGEVSDAVVMIDRQTGRSRGFGFVTMPDDAAAASAIEAVNETEFEGRTLRINEAKARPDRGGGGGGGGRRSW
ncbi:MAG: RNA-binding protein [Phycisphaera sp.]|nr:RNA-binding protein [Phycisphaera sp.]